MKSARFLVVCLIFVFVCVSIASAQLYRFERASASSANQDDTGTYQSGNAMNNYGAVTGRYLVLNFGYFGAFTYGPPQILSNLSSAPLIRIRTNDMNDSRVTVGGCGYSANNPVNYTPCYWGAGTTEPTAMITDQNGYVDGEAIGINNLGKVVGFYREATGTPHPFVRDSAGDVIHLAGEGSAEGINDSSEVVGYTDGHGFIWDAQNGQRLLNTHIGNTGIWNFRAGLKINSQGHILGKGDTNFQEANFYWDGETVWFLGYTATYTVNGMNDYGEIVGSVLEYNPETFLMEQKGWRWDKNNGLKMLNNIAPTDGEWFWSNAADINNSGQILADGDRPSDSLSRAWILTPKEVQPLIFIPGIGGSTLHLKNEDGSAGENLWTSGIITNYYNGKLEKLSLNPVANPSPSPIVAVDPVGQVFSEPFYTPILNHLTTTEGYVRYDIEGDPRKRKIGGPHGCTGVPEGLKPTLFVFAYDWRNSNEEAAERLKEFVDCVRLFYPNQKVNMLTHSMGGLVARKYVLNHPNDHHIRKMVTTVAPWFGAPKAYDTMHTGAFLGKNGAYFHYQAVKDIVQFGKGAHELLPSTGYYSASNVYPFGIQSFWGDPIPYDYWKTFEYFDNKYSGKPYTNSSNFHEYPGQDNWRDDTSGINYFHLYGVQNCHVTPGQVFALGDYALPLNPSQLWFRVKVNPTPGDKTVPKISADRPSNTLAPGTQVREYKPSTTQCTSDYEVEHTKILANPRVWNDISDILEDRPLSPPNVAEPEGETGNDATGLNYLSVMGVDRLDLTDDQDNSNTPITDIADQALEDVDYEYGSLASETAVKTPHRVTFGTEKTLDIKFTAQTQKIYIELSQGKSPETAGAAIKYLDLDLPAGVRAQLRFTTKGVENLRYDGDGDGEFETEVQPTFVLTDEAAGDTKEPQIQVSYTVTGNVATVTATATDAETGIEHLRYFIDGDTTDHIYDSPFTLNMDQTRMVYFAAQDNAGNRKLILKWVDLIPPVTAFSQTAPPNAAGWNTSDTTVELRSTDDVGGSGVSTLTYGGSGDQSIPTATLTKEFDPMSFPHPWTAADSLVKTLTMHHEGITDLNYYAVDKGGNTETLQTRTIRIDKTLPITTHELSDNGTLTTITLTANDVISGVYQTLYSIDGGSYQVYSAPLTVSSTGGHYVRYYSKDVAGNDETPRTVFIHPEDVANSVLISEFRARGYLGADDEFIELYNNGDTAVDISGWTINVKHGSNTTPVLLATIAGSIVIPPRGHYLLRKDGTSNYSLSGYAGADQTYTGALGDNCGIKLVSTSSTTIDAVGFASVTDSTYREGTGITPSAGITTSGQYSFARNFSVKNLPVDSNNSKNDFLFVSTDAATYNNLKSILGSPGPENLSSQVYREGAILVGQVDDTVTLAESPNRFYNYSETDPVYPVGTISVRRRLFNNTGQTITQMRLRVTAVTTKNSAVIFPTQAVLRLLNTSDMTVMTADGNWEIELNGITVDGVPTTVNGGLNSSYLINLGPNGLLPDETVNINMKAGIVTNGQYKLEFRFETVQ